MGKVYKLIIGGELPSLNEYIRTNRYNKFAGNKQKQDTEGYIGYHINAQLRGVIIDKPVFLKYTWYCESKKKDKDNISFSQKFVQDALVKSGVLKNDGWNEIKGFEHNFEISKTQPRVEIEIIEE